MGEENKEQALTKTEQRAPVTIGQRGLQLQNLEELWRFSNYVAKSGLAPKGIQTPEAVMIAVQMGLEIGLTPMAALQNIAVINGRPGIYGDAALAVVRASGLLEDYEERYEGEGEKYGCVVTSKRKGSKPLETRFCIAHAKQAGLWGKEGPWKQYPDRMLKFRARGFNLRDNFGDVLKGFRTTEELADTPAIEVESTVNGKPALPAPTFTPVKTDAPQDATVTRPEPPKPVGLHFRIIALLEAGDVREEQMLAVLKRKKIAPAETQELCELPDDVLKQIEQDWEMIAAQARIDAKAAAGTKEFELEAK